MINNLSSVDIGIVAGWLIFMMGFGLWISYRSKKNTAQDYFLASKSLPWWAVGGSLIASNISAEQFIGMSGSGYAIGLAIAAYELMAAVTLIVVAKFFLPVFLDKGIYTMPQFLEQRFDRRVKTGLAFFWVLLFVFVNITSVLYLGSLAIETIVGIPMMYGIIGLALYAATFSITGGLKAVVWTDVIQVVVLIVGGLIATYAVLNAAGGSVFEGLQMLMAKAPEKFNMIINKGEMMIPDGKGGLKDAYLDLPGISVLVGGMWIANLYYWGNNQYIIQRALASRSLDEAQTGTAFAALIKVILPLIVVIPGIAAYALGAELLKSDQAYPWVLSNFVGTGFKGLALAALIAAIGSSISSMVNSASTIFTLDIFRPLLMKQDVEREQPLDATQHDSPLLTVKEERFLVRVGKVAAASALLIGVLVAPTLGTLDQAFQYIQEYTGFISPGIVAIFILGMFWKKTSTNAALVAVILAIPLSAAFKFLMPALPFIDRMGLCFLLIAAIMVIISWYENKNDDVKAIYFSDKLFRTSSVFNILSILVIAAVAAIYIIFW
ncbi:MAG: sodium/solute symporter [Saprospiraceae bacterium]|nr:sodium/solute symporter [Saprospiraceae bacterium]